MFKRFYQWGSRARLVTVGDEPVAAQLVWLGYVVLVVVLTYLEVTGG